MALASCEVIYLREEKISKFVPCLFTWSLGIFVAQGVEGHRERIVLSREVD